MTRFDTAHITSSLAKAQKSAKTIQPPSHPSPVQVQRALQGENNLQASSSSNEHDYDRDLEDLLEEGPLYPFQKEGVRFLVKHGRAALFDVMGLGKTVQAIVAGQCLLSRYILIICPSYAIDTWIKELAAWWPASLLPPECVTVLTGDQRARKKSWDHWNTHVVPTNDRCHVLITTYHHIEEVNTKLWKGRWDLAILDEAHAISNHKTQSFKNAKKIASRYLFLLTGTPIRKNPVELWTYAYLVDKKRFPSFWAFANEHCFIFDGHFGKEIGGPKNKTKFRETLRTFALRRTKEQALPDLPTLQRQLVLTELSPKVRKMYDTLTEEMILDWDPEKEPLLCPNKLALSTRLRQLTICPELLGIPESSVVLTALHEHLQELLLEGNSAVVFTPFAEAIPYIREAIPHEFQIHVMCGDQGREKNAEELFAFQEQEEPSCLLATTSLGASWSATRASHVFFCGWTFAPNEIFQCEARLHRHGQKQAVNAYYLGAKNSIDEHIVDVLNQKVSWSNLVLDPHRLLKGSSHR